MSSRAIYRLGKLIVECTWMLYATAILAVVFIKDAGWVALLGASGLALWCMSDMNKALDALRQEANRDTRLGLNGPARQEDLL